MSLGPIVRRNADVFFIPFSHPESDSQLAEAEGGTGLEAYLLFFDL